MPSSGCRPERKLLKDALTRSARKAGLPFSANHHGSCLNIYFSDRPPHSSIVREDTALIGRFHLAAMNHGLFLAPRGMIALSNGDDTRPTSTRSGSEPPRQSPTSAAEAEQSIRGPA